MGYVELINKLETLPREKQAEVIEFVDFLAERCGTSSDNTPSQRVTIWSQFSVT